MCFRVLWLLCAVLFVSVVGPIALVLGKVNGSDPDDLYLLLGRTGNADSIAQITQTGAVEIGPLQATFARMVHVPPHVRTRLLSNGYVLLPAGHLVGTCGFGTALPRPSSRNT